MIWKNHIFLDGKVMRKFFLLPLLLLLLLTNCKSDESSIGDYSVYVKTTYSEYQTLRTPNRAVTYTADRVYSTNFQLGYGGICIFRDINGTLGCCDLACPYEKLRTTRLTINMPFATCEQCGSKFDLSYGVGNVMNGPATTILKMYSKVVDRGDYILVTN